MKRFKKLLVWDIVSLSVLLVLLMLDNYNVYEWNNISLYPLIRIPLVVDMAVLAFCLVITIISIIDIYDDN